MSTIFNAQPAQNHQLKFGFSLEFNLVNRFLTPVDSGALTTLSIPATKKNAAKKAIRAYPTLKAGSNLVDPEWVWRYVTKPEWSTTPCNCECIHLGLISVKGDIWRIGQERPVMLMTSDPFFGIPYPRYTEDDNYRQVLVKNIIHDIRPTHPFEIPRMAFVLEDCGPSYFLISVECD
jgi:hypothetical protein